MVLASLPLLAEWNFGRIVVGLVIVAVVVFVFIRYAKKPTSGGPPGLPPGGIGR